MAAMPILRRKPSPPSPAGASPAPSGSGPTGSPARADLDAVGSALVAIFEGALTDGDGRIRVEDLLSAAAAACGEACIVAAGEFDPEDHRFTPGSAVLSDRVNGILCADAADWSAAGTSVYGVIHDGALTNGYVAADFPSIADAIRVYVAGLGSGGGDPEADWGRVPLSVADVHRPFIQPLRRAYELRPAVRRVLTDAGIPPAAWPTACATALVIELGRVRPAIDPGVAVRIVLETVNGMAKMAPMTDRHLREGGAGQAT